jgi:hypothetical protein
MSGMGWDAIDCLLFEVSLSAARIVPLPLDVRFSCALDGGKIAIKLDTHIKQRISRSNGEWRPDFRQNLWNEE